MMPKKKKKIVIITSIISILLIIIGILIYLYLTTDMFKSNDVLFYKYLLKGFDIVDDYKGLESLNEEVQLLENNKYTSNIEGTIKYTEDGNKENPINKLNIKIDSQIDKNNGFDYKDIKILKNEENLFRTEYINDNDIYSIRVDGIKQFVTLEPDNEENEIYKMIAMLKGYNIEQKNLLTEEEKDTIKQTYSNIIYQNIPLSSYKKETGVSITVNEQQFKTNVYYVTMTKEEFNNIYILILEQIKQDEIIMSKLTSLKSILKGEELTDSDIQDIKDEWTRKIENEIQKIKSSNIGQEERTIAIYENNGNTLRFQIQTDKENMTLDQLSDSNNAILEFNKIKDTEKENSQSIRLQKTVSEKEYSNKLTIKNVEDGYANNIQFALGRKSDTANNLTNTAELKIYNTENEAIININENISIVNDFKNLIELGEENNINLEELNEEQVNNIVATIQENLKGQLDKVQELINESDISSILVKLNLEEASEGEISNMDSTTEAERNRFNSQFEFYIGDEIEKEKIKGLIEVAKENLESVKITEYEEKDREEDPPEPKQYKMIIKKDCKNEELANSLSEYIEENKGNKYSVKIEYNEKSGLVENIFITIEE